jgi:NADPH2:quinone reductase
VPPIDIMDLSLKGTLNIWRPGVHHFLGDPVRFRALMTDLFDLVGTGVLKTVATRTYPLQDAVIAHGDAESAAYAGPVVLLP